MFAAAPPACDAFARVLGSDRGSDRAPAGLRVGLRIRCLTEHRLPNDGRIAVGSYATVAHIDERQRVSVWFDVPRVNLTLDPGEYELTDQFLSREQAAALRELLDAPDGLSPRELHERHEHISERDFSAAVNILQRMRLVEQLTDADDKLRRVVTEYGRSIVRDNAPMGFWEAPERPRANAAESICADESLLTVTRKRTRRTPSAELRVYPTGLTISTSGRRVALPVAPADAFAALRGAAPNVRVTEVGVGKLTTTRVRLNNGQTSYQVSAQYGNGRASIELRFEECFAVLSALENADRREPSPQLP